MNVVLIGIPIALLAWFLLRRRETYRIVCIQGSYDLVVVTTPADASLEPCSGEQHPAPRFYCWSSRTIFSDGPIAEFYEIFPDSARRYGSQPGDLEIPERAFRSLGDVEDWILTERAALRERARSEPLPAA